MYSRANAMPAGPAPTMQTSVSIRSRASVGPAAVVAEPMVSTRRSPAEDPPSSPSVNASEWTCLRTTSASSPLLGEPSPLLGEPSPLLGQPSRHRTHRSPMSWVSTEVSSGRRRASEPKKAMPSTGRASVRTLRRSSSVRPSRSSRRPNPQLAYCVAWPSARPRRPDRRQGRPPSRPGPRRGWPERGLVRAEVSARLDRESSNEVPLERRWGAPRPVGR